MIPEGLASILPAVARTGSYVCVFVMAGAAASRVVFAPALQSRQHGPAAITWITERTARWTVCAAVALLGLRLVQLYGQTHAMFGQDEPVTGELMTLMATSTTWGAGWRTQTACAALAVLVAVVDRRLGEARRLRHGITAVTALLVVASVPLTGHALENSALSWPLLFQVIHVAGAASWIGSLLLLVTVGASACERFEPSDRAPAFAALVERFSSVALGAFAALAVSGAATSVVYLGELGRLFTTVYGRTLLLKLTLVLGTVAFGAYNWRRVRPHLVDRGAKALRFSAGSEIVLALVVLGITALLVVLPMPGG